MNTGRVMSYFDDPKNVRNYTKMAEGYDGRELVRILSGHLEPGSSVLELGMGPGKDLDILKQQYKLTGSDSSQVFLDAYQGSNPSANLLLLNAETLETTQQFDCIYSNKGATASNTRGIGEIGKQLGVQAVPRRPDLSQLLEGPWRRVFSWLTVRLLPGTAVDCHLPETICSPGSCLLHRNEKRRLDLPHRTIKSNLLKNLT